MNSHAVLYHATTTRSMWFVSKFGCCDFPWIFLFLDQCLFGRNCRSTSVCQSRGNVKPDGMHDRCMLDELAMHWRKTVIIQTRTRRHVVMPEIFLRNILNFQFLVLLPFLADLLQSVNQKNACKTQRWRCEMRSGRSGTSLLNVEQKEINLRPERPPMMPTDTKRRYEQVDVLCSWQSEQCNR